MATNPSTEGPNRRTLPRVIAGILALLAVPTVLSGVLGIVRAGFDPFLSVFGVCALVFVALCVWFALRGDRATTWRRLKIVVRTAFIVGVIGFAAGFFGPPIWAPEANQGPLLGVFVTGPAGFVLGAALGWLIARVRVRPQGIPSRI